MASIQTRTWTTKTGEVKTATRVQYYVGKRKRFKQFKSPAAARRFVETVGRVREREIREQAAGKGPRIRELAEDWLAACTRGRNGEPPLEPETVVFYRGHVHNHILPAIGSVRVSALTGAMVREFRETLLAADISRRTAKKILTTLKTLTGFALEEGHLTGGDPTHRVSIRLSARDKTQLEIHSKDEMREILKAADRLVAAEDQRTARSWRRYRPLLLTLLYAGLRISEARGLERDAVDTAGCSIVVRQRADKRGRIGSPKSADGTRRIYVPENLAAELESWLRCHSHPLVFPAYSGRPVDTNNVRKRMWEVVQDAARVRVLTLHSLRHFFASRHIEMGCNPKELTTLMGHSDGAFTMQTYGHLFEDRDTKKQRRERANDLVLA